MKVTLLAHKFVSIKTQNLHENKILPTNQYMRKVHKFYMIPRIQATI